MDPTTLSLLAIPALLGALYYVSTRGARKRAEDERIAMIKERAATRAKIRENEEHDPYAKGIELNLALGATEIDNRVDGYGDLTEEQRQTIQLIHDGYAPTKVLVKKKYAGGPSIIKAAGIPLSHSVFDEGNTVYGEWK
jgi:hypothetical protein